MTRRLTPQTTLENLKKEAKRFLKALAAGDKNLREKLLQAWPDAPAKPVLRAIQYAIARQYGFEKRHDLHGSRLRLSIVRPELPGLQVHQRLGIEHGDIVVLGKPFMKFLHSDAVVAIELCAIGFGIG